MTDLLTKYTTRFIRMTFPHLKKFQIKNMSQLIVAFFFNNSFTLREIASKMSGDTNVKHKLKKLKYFLDSLVIDVDFWKGYVKTIFALPYFRLGRRKYLTILIDATTLRADYWVLAASISYRGRSIPIFLKIWKGVNEPYNYWERVEEFIRQLGAIMPKKFKYELITDRGFQGLIMFDICRKTGWDYVVRINGSYSMKRKDGSEYIQLSLFDDGLYRDMVLGKTNPTQNTNVVVNTNRKEDGREQKWFLATSLEDKDQAVNDYSLRMWIEESFKDLKGELNWECYTRKIPEKSRLEKSIIISTLSYAIRLSIGSSIDVPPSEEAKTSVLKRVQHLLVSGYRKIDTIYKKIVTLFRVYYYRLDRVFV